MWAAAYFLVFAYALSVAALAYYGHLYSLATFSYAEDLYKAKQAAALSLLNLPQYSDFRQFYEACTRPGNAEWRRLGYTLGVCVYEERGRAKYRFAAYVVNVTRRVDFRGLPACVAAVAVETTPPLVNLGFYAADTKRNPYEERPEPVPAYAVASLSGVAEYGGRRIGPPPQRYVIYYVPVPAPADRRVDRSIYVEDYPLRARLTVNC